MKEIILFLSLIMTSSNAFADVQYDLCIDAAGSTNQGFAKCGGDWIARADAALNKVWKELYSDSSRQTKIDLLAEQRLWNEYKESSCKFLDNGEFGREGQVIHFPICRAGVIEERTDRLQRYRSPQE